MKLKTLTLALALLLAGTAAQAAVHETPQPTAPAVVGKAHANHAASKKHNKAAKKHQAKSKKKGAKKHGKTAGAHHAKSTPHVH